MRLARATHHEQAQCLDTLNTSPQQLSHLNTTPVSIDDEFILRLLFISWLS
jgi:hypothetical protein